METTKAPEIPFSTLSGQACVAVFPVLPDQPKFAMVTDALGRLLRHNLPAARPDLRQTTTLRIGLAAWVVPDEIEEQLLALDRAGCTQFVCWGIGEFGGIQWPQPPPAELEGSCVFVGSLDVRALLSKLCPGGAPPCLSRQSELGRVLEARQLYRHLARFGHGGEVDITNAFLAPAQILAQALAAPAADGELRRLVQAFFADSASLAAVTDFDPIVKGTAFQEGLGRELREAWDKVGKAVVDAKWKEVADSAHGLMELLTRVRALAGKTPSPHSRRTASTKAEPIDCAPVTPTAGPPYRVLVIDDNASDWKRVFEVLAQRLGAGVGPVAFEFSTDAATVKVDKDASIDMWQVLPEYDAVLLDIYLPWPKTLAHQEPDVPFGLEVLKRIRTMLIRLPVIVWTSSMRPDLPARATMANGFLFKKDTTLGGIADTLGRWLVQGRSKRGSVLLHPFFDYGITSPMLRPQAVMLTNWSLKFVDSFHALDTSFYRFFNDHGGRHTTGVLALTERLLASLLMGDRALVFSDAPEERQMELFSIYVAALCHDVGMFPFDSDEQDRSRLGSKQRGRRIRRQHALRGLSLVWRCETYTSDRNFGELARMLGNMKACLEEQQDGRGKRCLARIALMVAYHSGLSDFARGFCTLDGNAEKRLNGNTGPNALTAEAVKGMLTEIDGALAEGDGTGGSRDRLRRACAVLRLADELDVDWTRTPAGFILQDPDRSLRDDTENFKRQVLRHVQVDRGEILLRFRCGPPVVAEVRNLLTTDLPEGEKATVLAGFSAWFGKMQNPRFTERPDGAMVEAIDDGLNRFFIRQERTDGQRQAAAFLTAVRVCTEMVAPYEHVMEVGLGCHIHFGQVDWGTFDAGELTILRFPPAGDAALCRGCHHVVIP